MMQIFIKMGLFSKIVKKQEGLEKNPYKFKNLHGLHIIRSC